MKVWQYGAAMMLGSAMLWALIERGNPAFAIGAAIVPALASTGIAALYPADKRKALFSPIAPMLVGAILLLVAISP